MLIWLLSLTELPVISDQSETIKIKMVTKEITFITCMKKRKTKVSNEIDN